MNHVSPRETINSVSKYPKSHTSNKPLHLQKIGSRETRLLHGQLSKERIIKKYLNLKTKHRKSVEPSIEIEGPALMSRLTMKMNRSTARHIKPSVVLYQGIKTSAGDEDSNSIRKPLKEKYQSSQLKFNQFSKGDESKVQILNKAKNYLVKKMAHNLQSDKSSAPHKLIQVQRINLNYYVPDIKINIQEYIGNQQYANSHLSHLMESISAFQMFSHMQIPKEMPKPAHLPLPQTGKITLVFDLDETLIHTQIINWNTNENDLGWGNNIQVISEIGSYMINLKIRPHVKEVLQRLKDKFQIGIFSASQQLYGKTILKEIDPNDQIFSFKLYRQHCFEMQPRAAHTKDLRIFKDRDLGRVILIDNSPHTYLFQKSNAIPIVSFLNDRNDNEMLRLQEFLMQLTQVKDIRRILKQYFKLDRYHHYNNMIDLVRQLYQ